MEKRLVLESIRCDDASHISGGSTDSVKVRGPFSATISPRMAFMHDVGDIPHRRSTLTLAHRREQETGTTQNNAVRIRDDRNVDPDHECVPTNNNEVQ